MSEQETFLKALAKDEDDTPTRLVYADWLDENGQHEEADRQRKWPAAKQWLVRLCEEFNPPKPNEHGLEDADEWYISYQQLVELGLNAVAEFNGSSLWISCGNNENMCDALRYNYLEFWSAWSIVTGIALPPGVEGTSSFSCAC